MMSIEDQLPKLPTQEEASVAVWRALGREFGLNHLVGYCITLGIAMVTGFTSCGVWIINQNNQWDKANAITQYQIASVKTDVAALQTNYSTLSNSVISIKGDVHDQAKDISDVKYLMQDMRDQIQSWHKKGN